jgi:hypothetical protein
MTDKVVGWFFQLFTLVLRIVELGLKARQDKKK